MTGNLVSSEYGDARDFVLVDRDRGDVAAIDSTFAADVVRRSVAPAVRSDLVWSPTTSQGALLAVINGARHTLAVENEEMDDRTSPQRCYTHLAGTSR